MSAILAKSQVRFIERGLKEWQAFKFRKDKLPDLIEKHITDLNAKERTLKNIDEKICQVMMSVGLYAIINDIKLVKIKG